jgi:adenosylhomocysteine nucleosidase
MICFIIAMESEAKPLTDHLKNSSTKVVYDKKVICGKFDGQDVAVVICGVGKVNAAAGTQYAIDKLNADKIVNIGVAGGLNSSLKVGQIYSIGAVVQYDFDLVQLNGTAIGTLNEFEENYLALTPSLIYPVKKLATADRFNDSPIDHKLIAETLGADIRDMECGAIAQVCAHAKVKCFSYKAISDVYGSGSTTDQFVANTALCAQKLYDEMNNIFEEVKNG